MILPVAARLTIARISLDLSCGSAGLEEAKFVNKLAVQLEAAFNMARSHLRALAET